jgi:hypothetical protein
LLINIDTTYDGRAPTFVRQKLSLQAESAFLARFAVEARIKIIATGLADKIWRHGISTVLTSEADMRRKASCTELQIKVTKNTSQVCRVIEIQFILDASKA